MRNEQQTPLVIMPPAPQGKKQSADLTGFVPGALLPAAQAIILAVSVFLAVLYLAWHFGALDPFKWAACASVWIVPVVIAGMIWRWSKLTWIAERAFGVDLDSDGVIGQPPEPQEVRIRIEAPGGADFVDLPCTPDQLVRFANGVTDGMGLTEAEWIPLFGDRSAWVEFRAELLRRGLAAWKSQKDRARGVELTTRGAKVFAEIAARPTLSDYEYP